MKKGSTAAAKQSRNISQPLTIGLDLGDRSSRYCVLDETASQSQAPTGCAAFRRTPRAWPWQSYSPAVPAARCHSTNRELIASGQYKAFIGTDSQAVTGSLRYRLRPCQLEAYGRSS